MSSNKWVNMDVVSIRKATATDKDEVIGINDNVYDGRDYLAEYFDDFIACPLTSPFVALIDNKIVGFIAVFIVDDGGTVVTRSGRMNPSVTGRGFYKQLRTHALRSSGVHRHAFTTVDANQETSKESFRAKNIHILTRPLVRFMFDARSLETLGCTAGRLNTPKHEDFEMYFSTDAVKSYLFPNDRVVVDWVPYRPISANIPLLCWSTQRTKVLSDVSECAEGNIKGLLTFCTTFQPLSSPYASNVDIYGTDTRTLKDHLVSHLRHIRNVSEGVTSLLVFTEPDFDMLELEKVFPDFGIHRSDWYDSKHPEWTYSEEKLFENEI